MDVVAAGEASRRRLLSRDLGRGEGGRDGDGGESPDHLRFRELFAATYDDVRRFVERRTHPANAPDVLSEVYLVAWRRWCDVPVPEDEARAWLFVTARHTLANRERGDRRRAAVTVRIATQPAPGAGSGARHDDDVAARVDLARAFARLSPEDQEVLVLTAWDGLTQAEAGAVLGVSPGTYGVRLLRARRRLARHLGAGNFSEGSAR